MVDEKPRRGYGEGSIDPYDTKDGERFLIRYRAYDPAAGKVRSFKQRGFATRRAASKALREKLQSSEDRTFVAPNRQTLAHYIETVFLPWITTQVRPSTAYFYERLLRKHVIAYPLGGLALQDIEADTLEAHYGVLATTPTRRKLRNGKVRVGAPLKARTIAHVHVTLHRVFGYAVDRKRLRFNPAASATPPAFEDRRPKAWSVEQLARFLNAEPDHVDHDFWEFESATGMRRGEALGLSWDDIDLDQGVVSIRRSLNQDDRDAKRLAWGPPKTKRGFRVVELDAATVAMLRRRRARLRELRFSLGAGWPTVVDHEGVVLDLVFCNNDGTPRHPKRISSNFDRAAARAVRDLGLPRISLHGLRHTWATLALKAGVDAKIVQERLGHTRAETTRNLYQHVMPGMQSDAAETVAALVRVAQRSLKPKFTPEELAAEVTRLRDAGQDEYRRMQAGEPS